MFDWLENIRWYLWYVAGGDGFVWFFPIMATAQIFSLIIVANTHRKVKDMVLKIKFLRAICIYAIGIAFLYLYAIFSVFERGFLYGYLKFISLILGFYLLSVFIIVVMLNEAWKNRSNKNSEPFNPSGTGKSQITDRN